MAAAAPRLSLQLRTFSADGPDSWQPVIDVAVAADRAGIGRVVVSDHVVFGESPEDYGDPRLGGIAGGKQPTGPDGHWLEPLTFLSMLAGTTSAVRLGTNVLLAALRRPAVLAKQIATLDVLSGGRVDLGVGVGWQRAEYEACGLDFDARGALLDHTLEVCRALWTQRRASCHSGELRFDAIHAMPKPTQSGGVPIWIGGSVNERSMRRLARFGDGWIPWGPDAVEVPRGIEAMRDAISRLGRDPNAIEAVGALPVVRTAEGVDLDATMEGVAPMVAAGVTDFRANLPIPEGVDAATEYLNEVVGRFDAAI